MNCSTWSGKLAGLSGVVLYFIGCSILDEAHAPFPAQIMGGGAGNQGGAAGSLNAGGSGVGGVANPCGNGKLDAGEQCDGDLPTTMKGCDSNCQIEECYQASMEPNDPIPVCKNAGEECGTPDDGRFCNGLGECADHCVDNAQTADEIGVDCGSSCMNLCPGDACDPATNGSMCPDGRCVDTVCCNTDCDTNCFACNLSGKVGDCTLVPNGFTDTNASMTCPVGQTCQGGVCTTKKANGQMCNVNSDCASGECVGPAGMKFCKQANGTPCADASVCASGKCTSNVCLP